MMGTKCGWFWLGSAAFLMQGVLTGCSSEDALSDLSIERYRAAGMAWTAEDIKGRSSPQPEDNASLVLDRAYDAWGAVISRQDPPMTFFALSESEAVKALKTLQPYGKALDLAETASKKPAYDPGWDPDVDYGMAIPELLSLRSLVRGLCLRAEAQVIAGNVPAGLSDWEAALRLVLLTRSLPDSLALVHAADTSLAVSRASVKLAHAVGRDVDAVKRLEKGLVLLNQEPNWRKFVQMDAYPSLAVLRNARSQLEAQNKFWTVYGRKDPYREAVIREGVPRVEELRKTFGSIVSFYGKVGLVMSSPKSQLEDVIKAAHDLEVKSAGDENAVGSASLSLLLSRIAAGMGHARAALAAVLLKRLDLSSQDSASGLESLDSPVRTDPLTGQTLGASVGKGRIKVWSVGADFTNDGGLSRTDLMESNPAELRPGMGFDEVAELPHPLRPTESRSGRLVPRMAMPFAANPGSMPVLSKGEGKKHELPPATPGSGPLSIRRASGLARMF